MDRHDTRDAVFWGLVAGLVVYVIRSVGQSQPGEVGQPLPAGPYDALRILDERFARGEVDVKEYNVRRDLLHSR